MSSASTGELRWKQRFGRKGETIFWLLQTKPSFLIKILNHPHNTKTIRYLWECPWFCLVCFKRFYVQKSNCKSEVFKNIETWTFWKPKILVKIGWICKTGCRILFCKCWYLSRPPSDSCWSSTKCWGGIGNIPWSRWSVELMMMLHWIMSSLTKLDITGLRDTW